MPTFPAGLEIFAPLRRHFGGDIENNRPARFGKRRLRILLFQAETGDELAIARTVASVGVFLEAFGEIADAPVEVAPHHRLGRQSRQSESQYRRATGIDRRGWRG